MDIKVKNKLIEKAIEKTGSIYPAGGRDWDSGFRFEFGKPMLWYDNRVESTLVVVLSIKEYCSVLGNSKESVVKDLLKQVFDNSCFYYITVRNIADFYGVEIRPETDKFLKQFACVKFNDVSEDLIPVIKEIVYDIFSLESEVVK